MSLPLSVKLDRMAARYAAKSNVSEMTFAIEQPSTGFTWSYGDSRQPYFIASITKLYTVAMIMQLRQEATLTLDTLVAELLGDETMRGLNVYDGHDYGPSITVRELLSQTSGIPDYFEQKRADGTTFLDALLHHDATWSFDEMIEMARAMPSRFAPSTPGKAQYCDTNYQLLGRIIEVATASSYHEALRSRISEPLNVQDTWLFAQHTLDRYDEAATIMHGRRPLHIPKTMTSFRSDGGVVSTTTDQLRFLRAFIDGELFPASYLPEMATDWRSVFSPLAPIAYGLGIMRFQLPRWQSPLVAAPAMIGHSGAFGSVLFHAPDRDLYVSGTVNQLRPRSLPYPLLLRLVAQFGAVPAASESTGTARRPD